MNKYQELVENVEKTIKIFNVLKTRISQDFVTKLSQSWGCEKDCITVELKRPKYLDKNKILTWEFSLVINVITPDATLPFPLSGFLLMTIKDSEMVSSMSIKYHDKTYNLNESIEGLSDIIFQEIQKTIEQGSWF